MATYNATTTNTPLSRVLSGRSLKTDRYESTTMFKPLANDKEFGSIYLFDQKRNLERIGNLEREDGGPSVEVKADYSSTNFKCKTIAVKNKIPYKFLRNADPVVQMNHKKGMSLGLAKMLWKQREQDSIDVLEDTANFTSNTRTLTGTDQWSDYENSEPWKDIGEWEEALEKNTDGEQVTDIWMNRQVITILQYHPHTMALLKNTEFKFMSDIAFMAILKGQLFLRDIPKLHIARTTKNTAKQGQTATSNWQAGKHFVMVHNNPEAGELYQETFGYMIYPTNVGAFTVEEFEVPGEKALYIEDEMTYGFKVVQEGCGQQAKSVIA